jgi:hypothetical protein
MTPKQRRLLKQLAAYPHVVYPLYPARWSWVVLGQFIRRYYRLRDAA